MKRRFESGILAGCMLACVLGVALVFAASAGDSPLQRLAESTMNAVVADLASDGEGDEAVEPDTNSERESFPADASDGLSDSLIGNPSTPVDYKQIIAETSGDEYRDGVNIADNRFCIIRQETPETTPVQDEEWFKRANATDYEMISSKVGEGGVLEVSYRITTPEEDIWSVVDSVNGEDSLEIAEPDYLYAIATDEGPAAPADVANSLAIQSSVDVSSNPDVGKQWYLTDQNARDVWSDSMTYGNTSGEGSVVAVIDTGVDYTHEDLANNIWLNTAELNGMEGVDDDGNGYIDDIYGINLIDSAATPQDDHGHGTHVAGIIAMENNEVGGVGLAYKSQIMAIKAGGSDGSFNSSDIAKALDYASKNGADVINMSFGSSAHSAIVENALQDAFASCVLVASAGNDGMPTLDAGFGYNCYPAAYSYVVGAMAYDKDGKISSFSNWDFRPNYGAEYEVAAPGSAIYSTLPGNRYASWNGTSMAAPVVSAEAAVLRSSHPNKDEYSSRYIMGQLVSATGKAITLTNGFGTFTYSKLDLVDSLLKAPKPNINIDEVYIFDSPEISDVNNGDGLIQPGETINFAVGLRNQWGAATDVNLTIDASSSGGVANPYVEYISGKEVRIDDIGSFGTQNNGFVYDKEGIVTGVSNPVQVKISEDAPNDLNINFLLNYTAKNKLDKDDQTVYRQDEDTAYVVSVVKGTILEGKITQDTTWTKDNYYIVKNNLFIPRGVTVTVEPGTQIQFWAADESSVYGDTNMAFIQVLGQLNVNGSAAEPVRMFPGKDFENYQVEITEQQDSNNARGTVNLSYVDIINPYLEISTGDHLSLHQDYDQSWYRYYDTYTSDTLLSSRGSKITARTRLSNSKISNFRGVSLYDYATVSGVLDTCLFDDCQVNYNNIEATNCTFLNNQGRYEDINSGCLQYYTSRITNVGNRYKEPQYTTATDIYTANGKKYVAYCFSNYYFEGYWDNNSNTYNNMYYENYRALEKALSLKGGHIATLDINGDNLEKDTLVNMYNELQEKSKLQDKKINNDLYFLSGIYYDEEMGKVVSLNESGIPSDIYQGNYNETCPFTYYWVNPGQNYVWDDEAQDSILKDCINTWYCTAWSSLSTSDNYFVLAEYPEKVDDYTVKNPAFDLNAISLESTKFTKNAILNRLTSTDISDWMKVTADSSNTDSYICTGNYWGTTNPTIIAKQVVDFDVNTRLGDIVTAPELDAPAESTYPCVGKVTITDKNGDEVSTLGNGEYTVHVFFNRDMDQSVDPMVTYGPDDPYTDYTVQGGWVGAREWAGTTNVKILVNQGVQYLRIKDAVAAGDPWLTTGTDWARFSFQIEGTGAEALTLQGEGKIGSVYLNWVQDEYDTMAGFNVYRSETGAEGSYKKANSSIISPDTKEFTDTKVLSGKGYYYYFTVIDTDMTESRPSNVISCASIDDEPPVVTHKQDDTLTYGVAGSITAAITDNVGVNIAKVHYRMSGDAAYKQVVMTNTYGNTFNAQIPARDLSVGTLEYYIEAADSVSSGYAGSAEEPLTVNVETKVVVTSVAVQDTEVGTETTGSIKGMNFTEGLFVRVDGNVTETTFINDGELSFTCTPVYMGKKKVELVDGFGNYIASFPNAFIATDSSVEVYGTQDVLISKFSNWQEVYLKSNFAGTVETIEIIADWPTDYEGDIYLAPSDGVVSTNNDNDQWNDNAQLSTLNRIFKMSNNTTLSGGNLLRLQVYNYKGSLPKLQSVKINGVEVAQLNSGFSQIKFIDESAYIPVEDIKAEESSFALDVGQSFKPEFVISPSNATRRNALTYDYDSNSLHQNEDGTFTLLRSGGNYLYVNCDGKNTEVYVYGNPIPVTSIKPERSSYTGAVGSTITVNLTAEPLTSDVYINADYDGSYIEEVSSNNNGRTCVFRLKKAGEPTIAFYTWDNTTNTQSSVCNVPVSIIENAAYTEIDEDVVSLYPNQRFALTARVRNAAEGAEPAIVWTSSNTSVATVSADGAIYAVGKGYAVITGSVDGGAKSDTIIVLVGTDSMSYTLGDVNMDGTVTSVDSMLALKLALCDSVVDSVRNVADVNHDGSVTAADAMLILQYVTGFITEF